MSAQPLAAVAISPEQPFELREMELLPPRDDEVQVKIKATGICHTDIAVKEQAFALPLPMVLGHEGAGVVEAVGASVSHVEVGDHVVLGGVTIPHTQAFKAHSDGDVLVHALCDALLGAVGLGDIGGFYPDTDAQYEGIDSRILLRDVMAKLGEQNWVVGNVDMTLIAQKPKMKPHISEMKNLIADDLNVSVSQLNIKATTTEGMGFTGRGEGIAAHAVVLLLPQNS